MTETRPSDGFVTADDITFEIIESDSANGKTRVIIKNKGISNELPDNNVVMYDDTTKVEFSKKDITNGRELSGCQMQVTDKDTGVVMDEWVSTEESHVVDERIPEVPDTPQTGIKGKTLGMMISLISLLMALGCFACVRAKDKSKYNLKQEKKENEENN